MAADGLNPNLDTFNAVCFVLSRCSRFHEARSWFMQVLNEMRSCNIGQQNFFSFCCTEVVVMSSGNDNDNVCVWFLIVRHLQLFKPLLNNEKKYLSHRP